MDRTVLLTFEQNRKKQDDGWMTETVKRWTQTPQLHPLNTINSIMKILLLLTFHLETRKAKRKLNCI